MSKPYIITGATTGGVYPRLEIADLMKRPMQFSLFVQALINLQKKDYNPVPASWQEFGGIHGLPFSRWSGDPAGPDHPDSDKWGGYCYHSTTLFPTWHRVLMLGVEQIVSNEAVSIYNSTIENDNTLPVEEKTQWHDAAMALRFPYWDWSAHGVATSGVPREYTDKNITIVIPSNKNKTVQNPLHTYNFNPIPEGADKIEPWDKLPDVDFAKWTRTYRWATGKNNPESDVAKLNRVMKEGLPLGGGYMLLPINIISEKLAKIFSFPPVAADKLKSTYWDYFATTDPQAPKPDDISRIGSLEDPHNKVHLDVGGTGDMTYNELAAFDPIFYMHHCNIDRLLALWEYCYPEFWMGSGYYKDGKHVDFKAGDGTYQEGPGARISSKTPLAPFRKDAATYWNSDDVRLKDGLFNLRYTYPPLTLSYIPPHSGTVITVTIDITKPASEVHRLQCIAILQGYYTSVSVRKLKPGDDVFSAHAPLKPSFFASSGVAMPEPSAIALTLNTPLELTHTPAHGYRTFTVSASLPQFAFRGSHRLELYVEDDLVDELSVFSRLLPEHCANCTSRIGAGNPRVRSILTVPQAFVTRVLDAAQLNTDGAPVNDVIETISRSIRARIVAPNGALLAEAKYHGASGAEETIRKKLSDDKSPSLQLYSARVLVPRDEVPLQWFADNWVTHGEILKSEWIEA